jgi:hypothetical protein
MSGESGETKTTAGGEFATISCLRPAQVRQKQRAAVAIGF